MAIKLNIVPLAQVPTQTEVEDAVRQLQQLLVDVHGDSINTGINLAGMVELTGNTLQNLANLIQAQQGAIDGLITRVEELEAEVFP